MDVNNIQVEDYPFSSNFKKQKTPEDKKFERFYHSVTSPQNFRKIAYRAYNYNEFFNPNPTQISSKDKELLKLDPITIEKI